MSIAHTMLPEFDHEMANTRKALERVPPAKFDLKPHEKSWSLIELASHLARLPSWGPFTLQQDVLDLADYPPQPAFTSLSEVLDTFDNNVKEARAAIAGASDAQLMSPWTLRSGDHVVFTMPKAAVLRSFVINHIIHHRGQLIVYLRMAGAKVPGMYGPSADESM